MLIRPKSFSILYGIQRSFLGIFYLISVVAVFWLIFYLLHDVLNAGGGVMIPVSIAYLVIIVLGYSIIHVISYIPANLAGAFDPLKNGIADRSIHSAAELSSRLAEFMCSFFNFAFFDVRFAIVRIGDRKPVISSGEESEPVGLDIREIEKFAEELKETRYYGKAGTDPASHLYVVPLIFGDKNLGYMAVATRQKLWKIFVQLLNEFENDYVDDQVVHILAGEAEFKT
jgi:hypothetical protein